MPKQKSVRVSVRPSELASAITQPKGIDRTLIDQTETVRYNTKGKSDAHLSKKFKESEACAQLTTSGRNNIYKIKCRRGGKLFNPLIGGSSLVAIDKTSNNSTYQFREVNRQAFDAYVKFLQTGYDSYLLNAERES